MTRLVSNRTAIAVILYDVAGDEVQIPPNAKKVPIEQRFIDFQVPPPSQVLIEGYDYVNGRFLDEAPTAPAPAPTPAATNNAPNNQAGLSPRNGGGNNGGNAGKSETN